MTDADYKHNSWAETVKGKTVNARTLSGLLNIELPAALNTILELYKTHNVKWDVKGGGYVVGERKAVTSE